MQNNLNKVPNKNLKRENKKLRNKQKVSLKMLQPLFHMVGRKSNKLQKKFMKLLLRKLIKSSILRLNRKLNKPNKKSKKALDK